MRNVLIALALTLGPGAASAQMNHGGMDHSTMAEGVHAEATLNTVSDGAVNVSHGPIPEIGWPAMTMDLPLLDGADLGGAAPGDTVLMMLDKGPDGMYGVTGMSKK